MQSAVYVGLSAQIALKQRMDTLAHNMANLNTIGFRSEKVKFAELIARTANANISFSSGGETYLSSSTGQMIKTGNALDVAVAGEGWMAIQTPDGPAYTRDGRFVMSPDGALQTLLRQPVLDVGGAPILLDPNAPPPVIARDGMISQGGVQVGAIGLFSLERDSKLTRVEGAAVKPDRAAVPIVDFVATGITQGFLENSNVNPVLEISRLIAVHRLFESVSAGLESTESSVTEAIRTLGSSSR